MNIVHIIPTYNEKENIGRMIETIEKLSRRHPKDNSTILIVDDNSPDGTAKIVKSYQKKYKNVYIITKPKEGLGIALIVGFQYAMKNLHADIVIPNDADFQWDPKDYLHLLDKITKGYDVVVASRHVPGGSVEGWSRFRRLNHEVSNSLLAWWFAGVHEVHDHAGNFKAIRVKGILDSVALNKMKNVGFSFQLHILYELSKVKAKFTEVGVIFKERKFGESKIGLNRYYLRDVVEYIKSSFQIRINRSRNFLKYCIVGGCGFLVQTIISKIFIMLKMHAGISVSIGAEGAIITNFIFNNVWTFKHSRISGTRLMRKFTQFNLVSIGAVITQGIIVSIGTHLFGISTWFFFMTAAIVLIIIPYSYFMYSRFIWKKAN